METMRDIKIRIKSINSTRKITESMRLISTRKVQKTKLRREANLPYFEQAVKIISGVCEDSDFAGHAYIAGHKDKLKEPEKSKKSLVIVINGDRGLCGGYLVNVRKKAQEITARIGDSKRKLVDIISVGTKMQNAFRRDNERVVSAFKGLSENPFYGDAQSIGADAIKLYENGEINQVYLVYTKYETMLTQTPKYVRLLPLDTAEIKEDAKELKIKSSDAVLNCESGKEAFFKYAVSTYIYSKIFEGMLDSAVCEQCARLTGMDSAVKNSEKIMDSLAMKYNQMRQSAITQEIAEIVGGANAVEK